MSKSLCGSLYMLWSVLYRKFKMAQKIEEHREVESFLEGVCAVAPQGLISIIINVLECYLTSIQYAGYLDENLPPCEAVISRYHALQNANKYINDKRNGAIYEVSVATIVSQTIIAQGYNLYSAGSKGMAVLCDTTSDLTMKDNPCS